MSAPHFRDRPPRTFAIDGEVLEVKVRESARARTARLIVGPRRPLELITRRGMTDAELDAFLESKRAWITKKVAAARAIAGRQPRLGLQQQGVAWLAGQRVPIMQTNGQRASAELRAGQLVVRGRGNAAASALERWYRREARRHVAAVAKAQAERLDLRFASVAIRDPRTRWGSCSRQRNLSFSWRLLLAPPAVLEYVVVHELLHLREPSHTRAFWRLVDAAQPGWREAARWLREHGQELRDYRPERALDGLL